MVPQEREKEFFAAHKLGLTDAKTAKYLGVPTTTYQHWRSKNGLKSWKFTYRSNVTRKQYGFTGRCGVSMKSAITNPDDQEKMNLFLRLAAKCRKENIGELITEIHKNGIKSLIEVLQEE